MDDFRHTWKINCSRALLILRDLGMIGSETSLEKMREKGPEGEKVRKRIARPGSAAKEALIDALMSDDKRKAFFEIPESHEWEGTRGRLKQKVDDVFNRKSMKVDSPCSFAYFIKEKKRNQPARDAKKRSSSALSLSQVNLSDGEDDVFSDQPGPSSTPRILRSSQVANEVEDNEENKLNASNLSSSSATELFKKQRLSFDGVDGAEDLRGFNHLAYHPKAIQILLSFLMRGLHGRTVETVFKTLCASLDELKGQNPPSATTINSKRFCIETCTREQLVEAIETAEPGGSILIDDATLIHSARATGIIYVNTKGRAYSIGLYETLVSKGEEMAKQILAKLRALPFWPTLKTKISFLVSENLERTHARLGLRRTFIVAEAMYNKTSEWLENMVREKQEEIVKKAMLERPKNEKKAKELEKEDRKKYLLKNARDEEEIAQEIEINEENEAEEEMEMEVGETVEDEPELEAGESIEDEPEIEDERSLSVPSF